MKNKSAGLRKVKLDIACGKRTKPGFKGVDIWEGADIVCDLEKFPWPFEDNSVDEIFCSHYIEHTPDLISFANELYRILKVGAKAEIIAPYYSSIRAWQDPTHLRAISENTFLYFNKAWREVNKLDHYPITSDFDYECRYIIDQAWREKEQEELRFAIKHYINVVSDIHAVLTKRKACSDEVEGLMRQAEELWELGQQQEASDICLSLLTRGEGGLEVNLMLAEYALQNGKMEEGESYFRQALQFDEESIQAHVGIARTLARAGRKDEALSHVEGIRRNDPALAEVVAEFVGDDLL